MFPIPIHKSCDTVHFERSCWSNELFRWYHIMDISPWLKYGGAKSWNCQFMLTVVVKRSLRAAAMWYVEILASEIEWLFICKVGSFAPCLNKFHYARLAVLRFWNMDFFLSCKEGTFRDHQLEKNCKYNPWRVLQKSWEWLESPAIMKVNELSSSVWDTHMCNARSFLQSMIFWHNNDLVCHIQSFSYTIY
jgi:hypothetical protein